ncbi:MAG: isoaspartyl peptidase/L-asparaginase [Alphaproteobacteria bacterium]|nr:isoaspartyl peptidase/L-asparaginase [Alphaproteobacteria bacterium]
MTPYAIALHGGAGVKPGRDYSRAEAQLRRLAGDGAEALKRGVSALDAVETAVRALEAEGLCVAGRGSAPNTAGYVELDASIMDGAAMRAGAVAAVRDVVHPITAARRVMDASGHVLLAGAGAMDFIETQGLARVEDPASYYRIPDGVEPADFDDPKAAAHGTVGAVALDRQGRLAAATSTGGTFGKHAGRVGDTPLIGPGTWADSNVAISATGVGEAFILAGGAGDMAARMRYGGADVNAAADAMLADVARRGGDGGVIAVTRSGEVVFAWNSPGMKRAAAGAAIPVFAAVV